MHCGLLMACSISLAEFPRFKSCTGHLQAVDSGQVTSPLWLPPPYLSCSSHTASQLDGTGLSFLLLREAEAGGLQHPGSHGLQSEFKANLKNLGRTCFK